MYPLIENRQIRVFVSSTFRDMQDERNYLMNTIFPRLRKKAAERDVSFVELDLRWGVTEKEAQNGKVVQICLNEIDNSHPFFIGLLGDRYGWCPPADILEQDTNLAERYPWIKDDIGRGISVTEIEMRYGVLRREENDLNACFFIKDDGAGIEPEQRALKEAVRRNTRYPYDGYATVEELGEKVEKLFTELLERLFPQTELSVLELERLAQRAFLHSRCHVYIRNDENFKRLDEFLADEHARYLVITGESGMGKSALVANWLDARKEDDSYCTIYHFVGNSGAEGDYNRILARLTDEIHDLYGIPKPDKMQAEHNRKEPKEVLQELIMSVADRKPLLIVLDGINQLAGKEGENPKLLNWLPSVPMGCKMLFSTLEDDETAATFRRREYPLFRLEPLDDAQREQLIVNYLSRYGKGLTQEQVARIAHDPESRNTLVLRTLLDELICFGIHEKLDERIDYYLAAESIGDFFQRVLRRAEEDYGRELVRDTLALIAVSYDGMSESELLDMAHITPLHWSAFYCAFAAHFTVRNGRVNFSHRHMHDAAVARYLDAQSERAFRRRVIDYFTNSGEFAERMEKSEDTRTWSELAHQYYCDCQRDELHALVLRPEVFEYFYDKNIERIITIWQQLYGDVSGKYSLNDYLAEEYENPNPAYYFRVGCFSQNYFKESYTAENAYNKALSLLRRLAAQNPEVFDSYVANTLNSLGGLHQDLQDYDTAAKEYREALEIYRCLAEKNPKDFDSNVAMTLHNLGILHNKQQDYETAEKVLGEALEIRHRLAAKYPEAFDSDVADTLNSLGVLHSNIGDYDTAAKEYREALEIYRCLAEKNPKDFDSNVAMTLHNLGLLHNEQQDYETAEKELGEALEIRHRLAAKYPEAFDSDVANTLNSLGVLHSNIGDYDTAEKEYREALEIYRHLSAMNPKAFKFKEEETLDRLVNLMTASKNYNSAAYELEKSKLHNTRIAVYRDEEKRIVSENNIGTFDELDAKTFNMNGDSCWAKKDYKMAGKLYLKALNIYRHLAKKSPDTFEVYVVETLNNLGCLYYYIQDYKPAENIFQEMREIRNRLVNKSPNNFGLKIANELYNRGNWCEQLKHYVLAVKEYQEALEIYRHLATNNPEILNKDVAATLSILGYLHYKLQDYTSAEKEYREALEIYRHLATNNPEIFNKDVATTLSCLGNLHYKLRDYILAEKEYREALGIRRLLAEKNPETFEKDIALTLNNLGLLHSNLEDYKSADKELQEALEIRRRLAEKNPVTFNKDVANTFVRLGELHFEQGNYTSAEKEFQEALEIYRRLAALNPDSFDKDAAMTLYNLGVSHYKLQDYTSAEKEYREALEIYHRLAEENPKTFGLKEALTFYRLGDLYFKLKNYTSAEKNYWEALEIYRHLAKKEPKLLDSVASVVSNIGVSHYYLQNYASAEVEFQEALEIYRCLAKKDPKVFDSKVAQMLSQLDILHKHYKS